MADALSSGFLLYSHILPPIIGFFAVLLIASGIMDKKREYALGGIGLFFAAGILPFLILPFVLGF
jgi:hypothetical protein